MHQDDDGFESLNGNVSSDNDKGVARATVGNPKHKKDLLHKNKEKHILRQNLLRPKFSGSICNNF